jgi:hypothetical protein
MTARRIPGLERSYLINDVFAVCEVSRQDRQRGHIYWATLANHARHYYAVAGPLGVALIANKVVRVRGCILLRQGKPVLVICSIRPVKQLDLLRAEDL